MKECLATVDDTAWGASEGVPKSRLAIIDFSRRPIILPSSFPPAAFGIITSASTGKQLTAKKANLRLHF